MRLPSNATGTSLFRARVVSFVAALYDERWIACSDAADEDGDEGGGDDGASSRCSGFHASLVEELSRRWRSERGIQNSGCKERT